MLKGIVILSLGIMMISSVMVLSLGVDDAFAGKGTKRIMISGEVLLTGAKVPLAACQINSPESGTSDNQAAKGNGVVHLALAAAPDGTVATSAIGSCVTVDLTVKSFTINSLATNGPTKHTIFF